ncbi:MAG: hypothetical protein MZU97_04305 [Bacillus subtilis]|nr:hypothetical protein [Bacillus subtilis]
MKKAWWMKNKTTSSLPSAETKTHFLIAYADLSTGETAIVQSPRDLELLFNEISNLGCKEIVVSQTFNQKRLRAVSRSDAARGIDLRRTWNCPHTIVRWLAKSTTKSCWRLMADSSTTSSKRNAAN